MTASEKFLNAKTDLAFSTLLNITFESKVLIANRPNRWS